MDGTTYGYMQGTSMACPHVSGIAALAISHSLQLGKKLTTLELRDILVCSTHDIDRYCTGSKNSLNGGQVVPVQLSTFKNKMGVGYIDAFKALMNVEGIPCVTIRTGYRLSLDITDVIGGNPTGMTDSSGDSTITVSMSQADRQKLGVEGDVVVSKTGKLQLKCTKPGSAIISISFIAGGTSVGSNEATGGMLITRKMAILSRSFGTNGGWL
jgi:subtilisin family serine protease